MKFDPFPLAAALATVALAFPALALDAPEDTAPPPPAAVNDPALPTIKLPDVADPSPAETSAFLGVVSSDIPDMLADHLGLKPSEGIVVRSLVPDGPAAKAGVTIYDVITKVGGKAIGSPADISSEISGHKPGDKLALDLIHKGKPATVEVTLGTRPAEMADAGAKTLDQLDMDGLPKELADRLRGMFQNNAGGMNLQMDKALRDLQKNMLGAMNGKPDAEGAPQVRIQSNATVKMSDKLGSVEVQSKDKSKEVVVRDKEGNVTWQGPWDTAQDKAAAPDDVRERIDAVNLDNTFTGQGLRLQMRQVAPDE
jgi:serine protease Do